MRSAKPLDGLVTAGGGRKGGPGQHQYARQRDPRLAEPIGKPQVFGQLDGELALRWSNGGNHQLRAFVERPAGIVERVDRRLGLKVQVAPPIDTAEQVAEEAGKIMDLELGPVF